MIEIVCDQYGLHDSDNIDMAVSEPSEYEAGLLKIKSHAANGEPLLVLVRNPAMFDWFDAAVKYGAKKTIIDPISKFESILEKSLLPSYLRENPHWVAELGLINIAKDKPPLKYSTDQTSRSESIDSWLKRVLLGKVWNNPSPASADDFSMLFQFFIDHKETSFHPLAQHLLHGMLEYWSKNGSELFTWLKTDPFKKSQFIAWEQILSAFPQEKISTWLQQDNIWFELSRFPGRHQLPIISINIQLPEKIAVFVKAFLLQEWNLSPETALGFISGTLDFEKHFLLERLRDQLNKEVPITKEIFDKLKSFEKFPEVIDLGRQLVPAKTPSIPSPDSSVDKMRRWIANEYLPFYSSSSLLGQIDVTEPYLEYFEQWLHRHYTALLFGDEMAYRQMTKLKERIIEGYTFLIVLMDGLDYISAQDVLLPAMQKNGLFSLNEVLPFFAFLPTQTYVSKPTLISGKMNSQIPDEVPTAAFYKELLQKHLGISENDIIVKTDKECTILEQIQESAKVYLYLDNHLDAELLHKTFRPYQRKKKYSHYLLEQSEKIFQSVKEFKDIYGKSLQVVICSDHGHTLIHRNAPVIDVPSLKDKQNSIGNKIKTRTIHATDLFDHDIGDIYQKNVWRLKSDLYGLSHEIIIPLGYSCFNKRPHGATHGGCSPQEMAVPWLFLSDKKPLPPLPLSFSIEGEIFRKRTENSITLNILNPNDYSVLIVDIEVSSLETLHALPLSIGKNDIGKIHLKFDASSTTESNLIFALTYRLRCLAGEIEESLTITVPTTGAMTTEFDDDFDF
ncbi:MAG: PglZ domain-containing protein [Desulfamplus sp.]|nr:PglZ domain-containing protein [Desulfamplus sp.]